MYPAQESFHAADDMRAANGVEHVKGVLRTGQLRVDDRFLALVAKPSYELVVQRVTNGQGAMPPFKGQLSDKQIADVTAYVVKATGGNPNG